MSDPDWNLPWAGGCRCDRLRFRVTAPPLLASACHCTGCQRMSSSAFSLTLTLPADGFEVTRGEPVIGGLHGKEARHYFCDWCKTWVFTRAANAGFVNLRPTMLDDHAWFAPFVEIFTSEKLPWAATGAPRGYEKFPEMDEYQALTAAFASEGCRPG